MDLKETGWEEMDLIYLVHDKEKWWAVVNTRNENFHSTKHGQILNYFRNYELLKKASAPWRRLFVLLVGWMVSL